VKVNVAPCPPPFTLQGDLTACISTSCRLSTTQAVPGVENERILPRKKALEDATLAHWQICHSIIVTSIGSLIVRGVPDC